MLEVTIIMVTTTTTITTPMLTNTDTITTLLKWKILKNSSANQIKHLTQLRPTSCMKSP